MSFEEKYEMLIDDMKNMVGIIAYHDGEASKNYGFKVLVPDNEFKFNLNNHYNGYVDEISEERLVSNKGNVYDYSCLDFEVLCELVDHLKEKYID